MTKCVKVLRAKHSKAWTNHRLGSDVRCTLTHSVIPVHIHPTSSSYAFCPLSTQHAARASFTRPFHKVDPIRNLIYVRGQVPGKRAGAYTRSLSAQLELSLCPTRRNSSHECVPNVLKFRSNVNECKPLQVGQLSEGEGCTAEDAGQTAVPDVGRGSHPSTSQLTLSRDFSNRRPGNTLYTP